MDRQGKLFFVTTEDWFYVSHWFWMGSAAKDNGFDLTVVTRCRDKAKSITSAGVRCRNFEMRRRGMNPLGVFFEFLGFSRILLKESPDLVHLVALRPVVVGALAAFIIRRPKYIYALTGLGYLFTAGRNSSPASIFLKLLLSFLLKKGVVIVQNTEDRDLLLAMGLASGGVRLIRGAGVDVSKFVPSEEPGGIPVVILPARMLWDKGVGEFVEAARVLRSQGVQARFALVGDADPDNPATVTLEVLKGWVNEGVVEHWGFQVRMEEVFPQCSIVCLPSYREGLPSSLLEGMACSRPCVTTETSGCREAVRHQDNGLLVPIKDAKALAEAIKRLLQNPAERQRMGARGRERAEKEFNQEIIIKQTLDIYREFLLKK